MCYFSTGSNFNHIVFLIAILLCPCDKGVDFRFWGVLGIYS